MSRYFLLYAAFLTVFDRFFSSKSEKRPHPVEFCLYLKTASGLIFVKIKPPGPYNGPLAQEPKILVHILPINDHVVVFRYY